MCLILCAFIFALVSVTTTKLERTMFTTDSHQCKKYTSHVEKKYTYFKITDKHQNGDGIDFHFSVKTDHSADLIMSPLKNWSPCYQITIDVYDNRINFKKFGKNDNLLIQRTHSYHSRLKSFWIRISKSGVIDIREQEDENFLLKWKDPNPLNVKFFGFRSFGQAYWKFECPQFGSLVTKLPNEIFNTIALIVLIISTVLLWMLFVCVASFVYIRR